MKKLFFVLAIMGIAGTAKAQQKQGAAGPVNIPGTNLGESGGPVMNINCKASQEICCVIWITHSVGKANTVTSNGKTYTFKTYTTKTDGKGNSTLTFNDAKPQ